MTSDTTLLTEANLRHPKGLWWLALIYAIFMCAFGGLLASITLCLLHCFHMPQTHAYHIFGAYASLLWTLPLAGGFMAGRYGYRMAAVLGIAFCVIGTILIALLDVHLLFWGLAAFVVGNAFFTSAVWCLVDHLYGKDDRRREIGFTLFYLLFNVGALIGILLSGYLDDAFGYAISFYASAGFCLVSMLCLLAVLPGLRFGEGRFLHTQVQHPTLRAGLTQFVVACLMIGLAMVLITYSRINNGLTIALIIFAVLSLAVMAYRQKIRRVRLRVIAFIILCFFSVFFWALYNLEPSLLSVFVDQQVDRNVFGWQIPSADFFAFEALFIVINGLLLSRFWTHLAKRGKNVSLPVKFGLSLLLIGLGYLFLTAVVKLSGSHSIYWWVMMWCYCLFAAGELFVGPLGISMVGRLSPEGQEGYLMGIWQLFMGFGGITSSWLAVFAVAPQHTTMLDARAIDGHLFLGVGLVSVVLAALMFVCAPAVTQLIRD